MIKPSNNSTTELIKKVRKIEIKSRGMSNHLFSGEYHSAFKGRGMTFSEVREYQPGDDIRTIDWNVTARFNHAFVKVFQEEREMTMMLLVDVSGSGEFGSRKQLKQELITELCAVLAFSAMQNNDKIGILFFSDRVEKFIPPKKGRTHILRIIRELIDFQPEHKQTSVTQALNYLNTAIKKRCIVFLVSDFMDDQFEKALQVANRKHDLVAIRVYDKAEDELPDVGLMRIKDAETGMESWIDTSSVKVREQYRKNALIRNNWLRDVFRKNGIDAADINTQEPYVKPLVNLFRKREGHR